MNAHSRAKTNARSRELLVDRVRAEGWSRREAAQALGLSVRTVAKWLRRYREEGLQGLRDRTRRARHVGWEHIYVCVDDHSRLSYVEPLKAEHRDVAAGFLDRAVAWFRASGIQPKRLLTDNGFVFRSHVFRAACQNAGMKQSFTKPYRPRTNGKAERFIQTMLREWAYRRSYSSSAKRRRALPRWLHHYNFHRLHSSLGFRPPASRVNNLINLDT